MKKFKRTSRAKFENIAYITLNVVNIITFFMIFAASIIKAKEQGTLANIIQAIYCSVISTLLILHEFVSPACTQIYFGFLNIHRGKSILMIFLGCLIMCEIPFNIIVAIIAFTIGFTYFLLSLVPSLPPPNGFLIHWHNHKDFWAEGLDLAMPAPLPPPTIEISCNNSTLLHYPHPSAWHPPSSKLGSFSSNSVNNFLTPVYNIDHTSRFNSGKQYLHVNY